jgi:hypothetical protein
VVAVANSGITTMFGNGNGTLSGVVQSPIVNLFAPVLADFNRDGREDLAGFTLSAVQSLLSNGDGTWTLVQTTPVEIGGPALVAVDFNRTARWMW